MPHHSHCVRYGGSVKDVKAGAIPADAFVLDIGGETRDAWAEIITSNPRVGTVVLYGPLGLVEVADTAAGTREVGRPAAAAARG